jgi:hypothetical protein
MQPKTACIASLVLIAVCVASVSAMFPIFGPGPIVTPTPAPEPSWTTASFDFTVSQATARVGTPIVLSAWQTSGMPMVAGTYSWQWSNKKSFGSANGQTATFTTKSPGVYTLKLTVVDYVTLQAGDVRKEGMITIR